MAIDTRIWGNRASSPQDPRGYFYDTAHLSLISPGFRLLGRNRAFVPPLFATPYFYALFWRPVSRVRSSCRDGLASGSNLPDTARNGGDTPPSSTQWASLSVRLRPARLLYGDLRRLWSVFLDFLSISSYMAGGSARSSSSSDTPDSIHGGGEPDRASMESLSAPDGPESGAWCIQSPSFFIRVVHLFGRRLAGFDWRLGDLDRRVEDLGRLLEDLDIGLDWSLSTAISTDMGAFSSFARTCSLFFYFIIFFISTLLARKRILRL